MTINQYNMSDSDFERLKKLKIYDTVALDSFNVLTFLNVCNGGLTSLPELPKTLLVLYCGYNQLMELPTLPCNLLILECEYNHLAKLPDLPETLTRIKCDNNRIKKINKLPESLLGLWCNSNQLSYLPKLPNELIGIFCRCNNLMVLPELPKSLLFLDCSNNDLKRLPVLNSLQSIWCSGNVEIENFPDISESLTYIYKDKKKEVFPSVSYFDSYCPGGFEPT